MGPQEAKRALKDAGFCMSRETKVGEIWECGNQTILVSRNTGGDRNRNAEVRMAIRRAFLEQAVRKEKSKTEKPLTTQLGNAAHIVVPPQMKAKATDFVKEKKMSTDLVKSHPAVVGAYLVPPDKPPTQETKPEFSFREHAMKTKPWERGRPLPTAERKRLTKEIFQLRGAGLNNIKIAERFNELGYKSGRTADGKWTSQSVAGMVMRERARQMRHRKSRSVDTVSAPTDSTPVVQAPEPIAAPSPTLKEKDPVSLAKHLPSSLQLMLDDPDLTTPQKLGVIRAARNRLPTSVQLMLDDVELTDQERLDVLRTLFPI